MAMPRRVPAGDLVPGSFAQQRAGDDEPLDLAGALVDLGDLGVAVVALDRELLGVAVAAEDLDRLAGDLAGRLGGEQLGLRALDGVRLAGLLEARGAPGQGARGLDARLHVGELLLDRLVAADGLAERAALLGVGDRGVQRSLRDAGGLGGDADAAAVERRERDAHAPAGAAEALAGRRLEGEIGGGARVQAQLLL